MIKLCDIPPVEQGIFIDRPNRFLSVVKIGDREEKVHVHDPGRLKELLYPGNNVLVSRATNKNRKTKWDMLCARKNGEWIFVHSGFHRKFVEIILKSSLIPSLCPMEELQAEVKIEDGRLDFLVKINNTNMWIETKGCTLIKGNIGLFPDAPTKRGTRHIRSLIKLKKMGDRAGIIVLVFSKNVTLFSPNRDTDPLFAEEFYRAIKVGVEVYPISIFCDGRAIFFNKEIDIT